LVDTESNLDYKQADSQSWQNALNEIPIGRVGRTIDCSQLAIFLASDASIFITDVIIPVDGGMTISWRS
jgi:NAD(P)-dependent dehydrogenase (short-subunit alcohol dehydrogenase family)